MRNPRGLGGTRDKRTLKEEEIMSKNIDEVMTRVETRLLALPHRDGREDLCFYCRWLSTAPAFRAWVCGYSCMKFWKSYEEYCDLEITAKTELKQLFAARISKLESALENEDMKLMNDCFKGVVRCKIVAAIQYEFVVPQFDYASRFPPDKLDRVSWKSWEDVFQEYQTYRPSSFDYWSGVIQVLDDEGIECRSFLAAARNSRMGNPLEHSGCGGFEHEDFLAVIRAALEAQNQK